MAFVSQSRGLFVELTPSAVKRILAGQEVRVVPHGEGLLLCARNFEELILVSPTRRKGGSLGLGYALRDPDALARMLDRPKKSLKEEKKHDSRTAQTRRPGRTERFA